MPSKNWLREAGSEAWWAGHVHTPGQDWLSVLNFNDSGGGRWVQLGWGGGMGRKGTQL